MNSYNTSFNNYIGANVNGNTNAFDQSFSSGGKETSVNDQIKKAQDSANEKINDTFSSMGLPPCNLNFGSLSLGINFFDLKPKGISLKLFQKIDSLGDHIKIINNNLINLIEKLNCCNIADTYNDNILPLFESLLDGFIKELVGVAEDALKAYQVFSVIMCVMRPVPGNPWMKAGGLDWYAFIYSILNGMDEIFKWIVNGNIIDLLLDPVKKFSDMLTSCSTPSQERLNMKVNVLERFNLNNTATKTGLNRAISKNLNVDNNKGQYAEKIHNLFLTKAFSNEQNQSFTECLCLFSILDVFNFSTFSDITISTSQDLTKIYGHVLWSDVSTFKELINDVMEDDAETDSLLISLSKLNNITLNNDNIWSNNLNVSPNNKINTDWGARYKLKEKDILSDWNDREMTLKFKTRIYNKSDSEGSKTFNFDKKEFTYDPKNLLIKSIKEDGSYNDPGYSFIMSDVKYFGTLSEIKSVRELLNVNDRRKTMIDKIAKFRYSNASRALNIEYLLEKEYTQIRRELVERINFEKYELKWVDASSTASALSGENWTQNGAKNILNEIGMSFDILQFAKAMGNEYYIEDGDSGKGYGYATKKVEGTSKTIGDLIAEFTTYQNRVDFYIGAENRLSQLILVENTQVRVIGDQSDLCGCDIICKLIQMIIDIIMEAIQEIIDGIVKNIINACLNEKVSYIIKFVLDKYQCYLNGTIVKDQLVKIKEISKMLEEKYTLKNHGNIDSNGDPIDEDIIGLSRMYDIDCKLPPVNIDPNDNQYTTIRNEIDVYYINETNLNNNNTDKKDGKIPNVILDNVDITGQQEQGQKIPTVTLNCSSIDSPRIEINMGDDNVK